MEQKDFKEGQILLCHYKDGDSAMCVFDKKADDGIFRGTNFTWFVPSGGFLRKKKSGYSYYMHYTLDIQWQLATMEQIKQYGYREHLDHSVQFPDAKPEKEAVAEPKPFTITEAMWEATQQNIAGLYIQIAKLNDKLEGKQ